MLFWLSWPWPYVRLMKMSMGVTRRPVRLSRIWSVSYTHLTLPTIA